MREESPRFQRIAPYAPVLLAVLLALITIPVAITSPGAGLDPSWLAGLNMAFRQHLPWGNGLVWTYGPFGFADFTAFYYFRTWLIALVVALIVHIAFFATLVIYLRSVGGSWWRWLVIAAALLIPLTAFPSVEYELTLIAFLLLYLSTVANKRAGIGMAVLSGVALGLLLTIKGTGVAAAAALWITYGIFALATRRPLLLGSLSGALGISFLALWTLAGQSPLDIPAYVRGSYEIISGYSAAMSLLRDAPLPIQHVTAQVAFGALVVISSAVGLLWAIWRRDRELVCLLLLATPILFLEFKEGYVRFGNRQLVFYSLAALIEALVFVRAVGPWQGRWPAFAALQSGAAALASALLISGVAAATHMVPDQASWPLRSLATRLGSYGQAITLIASGASRADRQAAIMRDVRGYYALGSDSLSPTSTIDILPWDIEIAYAYGLNWEPRSVFASYQAYTAYLDQMDAAHFSGADAPQTVLIAYESIDGRYPPFDEPAVMRALLDHYQVSGQTNGFLILAHNAQSSTGSLTPIESVQAHLGQSITVPTVPAGSTVYASVRVPYSLWGRAMTILFQPSELHITLQVNGQSMRFRFIPAVAADGIVLGRYVGSLDDLGSLLKHESGTPISSFTITADRVRDYQGSVEVRFYSG